MKMKLALLISMALTANLAMADNQASAERGKALFTSTALGTNGKSCASCHPGGKGLEKAAAYTTKKLEKIVTQCITKALDGKAFASGSNEMTALVSYIQTLGSP